MSKGLEALENLKHTKIGNPKGCRILWDIAEEKIDIIEKELKALEIIKEDLVVGYDEGSNDKPCLVIGVKVSKDNLVIICETFEQDKIDLLKEVLK